MWGPAGIRQFVGHQLPGGGFGGAAQGCRLRISRGVEEQRKFHGRAKGLKVDGGVALVHWRYGARLNLGALANHSEHTFAAGIFLGAGLGLREDLSSQTREIGGRCSKWRGEQKIQIKNPPACPRRNRMNSRIIRQG